MVPSLALSTCAKTGPMFPVTRHDWASTCPKDRASNYSPIGTEADTNDASCPNGVRDKCVVPPKPNTTEDAAQQARGASFSAFEWMQCYCPHTTHTHKQRASTKSKQQRWQLNAARTLSVRALVSRIHTVDTDLVPLHLLSQHLELLGPCAH